MGEGAASFPTGTVTLMFSDIQGSCVLFDKYGEEFVPLLQRHHSIFRENIRANHGWEVGTEGDAFMVAFPTTRDALQCAIAIQRSLWTQSWAPLDEPLRVRMGLHTGAPIIATHPDGKRDYLGPVVNRSARVMQCAHGGQLVISGVAKEHVTREMPRLPEGVALVDLGRHRLKGLDQEEQLFQVNYDDVHVKFPPLGTV